MPLTSSCVQVPLLVPAELHGALLDGAAELIVERGSRNRCFLHVYNEEERVAKLGDLTDPDDPVRSAHERRLNELRWARRVLWAEPRVQRFVRYEDPRLWPSHELLAKVVDVARQLVLCGDGDGAAALQRAREMREANDILQREATLPGLHPLKESTLDGVAALYEVRQTRKRSRDPTAATLPWILTRADKEAVESVAWIAEVRHVTYAVSEVLQLQLAAAPLARLVELLAPPAAADAAPADAPAATPAATRQRWRTLLERHRREAEYHSLFADVEEACRGWGATEAHVARQVNAAVLQGASVQLRTGVHASVVERRELFLLCSPQPRKLESVTAAEQAAFAELYPSHSWAECIAGGLVRLVTQPAAGLTASALSSLVRLLFLSPALDDAAVSAVCTVSESCRLGPELHVARVSALFNPFVVLHGSRVAHSFAGDLAYFAALQRERDALVGLHMEVQLQQGLQDGTSRSAKAGSASARAAAAAPTTDAAVGLQRQMHRVSGEAALASFSRAFISALAGGPLTKTELRMHAALREYQGAMNFETVLASMLKEHAEYKGRKYRLRD